jgi:hypothetical protein
MVNRIILSIIPVSVPMWEVYCVDADPLGLLTTPVLALGLFEVFSGAWANLEEEREAKMSREVLPLTDQGGYIGWSGYPGSNVASNLLGYSYEGKPNPGEWAKEISDYQKTQKK